MLCSMIDTVSRIKRPHDTADGIFLVGKMSLKCLDMYS